MIRKVVIRASAKQRLFLGEALSDHPSATVLGYGGARGGGKTWASHTAALGSGLKWPNINILLARKGQTDAIIQFKKEIMDQALELGVNDLVQFRTNPVRFEFWNGSRLFLRYIKDGDSVEKVQGLEFARIGVEEATQIEEAIWDGAGGSNRSNNPNCPPLRWLTCNPGGPGHAYVKERFVDAKTRRPGHLWIPSTIFDNPGLWANDPGYVSRILDPLPEWQRRQWRDGDWDAIAGSFWVLPPETVVKLEPPRHARWAAGLDWGRISPFACVFIAFWTENWFDAETMDWNAKRRVHVYADVYQTGLDAPEQAKIVKAMEETLPNCTHCVYFADPSTGKDSEAAHTLTGRTVADLWLRAGLPTQPAATNARVAGWNLIKQMLADGTMTIDPRAKHLMHEMVGAQYMGAPGPPTGEDLDQSHSVADHAMDAMRYCMVSKYSFSVQKRKRSAYEVG